MNVLKVCRLLILSILLPLLGVIQAAEVRGPEQFSKEIERFRSLDAVTSGTTPDVRNRSNETRPVLFLGSSSIRLWKTLETDFPRVQCVNRGFGGSRISDSIFYYDSLVPPHRPERIVFYAGGNDLWEGRAPVAVAADFSALCSRVWRDFPGTRIFFISSMGNPRRWSKVADVRELNRLINRFGLTEPRLTMIDVFPKLLLPSGDPDPALFQEDRLHLSAAGYAVLAATVRPYLIGLPSGPVAK
jgi:hypothetical protein